MADDILGTGGTLIKGMRHDYMRYQSASFFRECYFSF